MNIDILPTVSTVTGVTLPATLALDGRDILPALKGAAESPHDQLILFQNEDVAALRTQHWKYLLRTWYRENYVAFDRFKQGLGFEYPQLYDMSVERPERYSQAQRHPEVLLELQAAARRTSLEFAPLRTNPPPSVVP